MEDLTTTRARFWQIKRKDGLVLGFTDHHEDIVYAGLSYHARGALHNSAIERVSGLAQDNCAISGAISHALVHHQDLRKGLYDAAKIICHEMDWQDFSNRTYLYSGVLANIVYNENRFEAEILSNFEALSHKYGRSYYPQCDVGLGSMACGVDLGVHSFSGKIVRIFENNIHVKMAGGFPEGYFEHGFLVVTAQNYQRFDIRGDRLILEGREITLWSDGAGIFQEDQDLVLIAGCNKSFESCAEKFKNAKNFQGFPHIPGEGYLGRVPQPGQHSGAPFRRK